MPDHGFYFLQILCLSYFSYQCIGAEMETDDDFRWNNDKNNSFYNVQLADSEYWEDISISVVSDEREIPQNLHGYGGFNVHIEPHKYIVQVFSQKILLFSELDSSHKHEILLTNDYTKDPTECACQKDDLKMFTIPNCDCCVPGSCQCPQTHICSPCGNENLECIQDSIYFNDGKTVVLIPEEAQKVIVTAKRNNIQFYRLVMKSDAYYLIKGKYFQIKSSIAAIRYGETYSYANYKLMKISVLILLLENSTKHIFYTHSHAVGLGKEYHWFTTQTVSYKNFEVFQSGARIVVGYSTSDNLHLNILQEFNGGEFRIIRLQYIPLPGLIAWRYYTTEEHHLLAAFGSKYTLMYEMETEYAPFQVILHDKLNGIPVDILFIKVVEPQYLILTIVWTCEVEFYAQNKSDVMFEKVKVMKYPKCTITSASKFEFEDSSYLILKRKDIQNGEVILLSAKGKESPHFEIKRNKEILDRIKREYESQMTVMNKMEEKLTSKFASLKQSETNFNNDIKSPISKVRFARRIYGNVTKPYMQLTEIENKISKIEFFVANSENKLNGIFFGDGPRLIQGDKDVRKVVVSDMVVENAYIGKAVGREESIEDTLQKLVRIGDKRIIEGIKVLNENIKMDDFRSNYINGIDVNKIVKEDRNYQLAGAKFSNGLVVKNGLKLKESQTVFGVDLSAESISLKDTAELRKCAFTKMKAMNGIEIKEKLINNDHIDDLMMSGSEYGEVFKLSGSTYINNFTILGNLKANSVMSVNVQSLLETVINLKKDEHLKNVSFKDLKATNLTTKSINGEIFPKDFVSRTSKVADFGAKIFDNIVFGDLTVAGNVNGIKTDLVVTKTLAQLIRGVKTFIRGIKVFGDLNIKYLKIDGIDLSFAKGVSNSYKSDLTRVFQSEIIIPELRIKGLINNGQLMITINDIAFNSRERIAVHGKKIFNSVKIRYGELQGKLSSISISSFVNTKFENEIRDIKIFVNDLSFKNVLVHNEVDGTNLTELFASVLYSNRGNQVINGMKRVNFISCKVIDVKKIVNGLPVKNFLLKNSDQLDQNAYSFTNVVFRFLKANKVRLPEYATLNNFPLKNIDSDIGTTSFNSVLTVTGYLMVKDSFSANTINDNLVDKLFHLLEDQQSNFLYGNIHFNHLGVDGPLMSDGLINNVNVSNLISKTINKYGNNFIGDSHWEEIAVPSIQVYSLVNNINFRRLTDNVVFPEENVLYLRGEKTFLHGCVIKGNLETTFINLLDLSKKILLKDKPQVITASYSLQGIKAQDAKIGFFNNKHLNNLSNIDIPRVQIKGPAVFIGHVNSRSVEIDGFVDGLDIKAVLLNSIHLNSSKIIINGGKYFLQPPTFSELYITELNEKFVDYETLRRKSLSTNIDRLNVNGKLKLNSVEAVSATVEGSLRNFMDRMSSGVKLITDPNQYMKLTDIHVLGDLTVGKLNDLIITQDLLSKKRSQRFPSKIHIGTTHFKNVTVIGLINDIEIATKTRPSRGIITKIFKNGIQLSKDLVVKGDVVAESLGEARLNVSKDLVLTAVPEKLSGPLDFLQPVVAQRVSTIDYVLNGMDISPLGFPGLYTEYFHMENYNWTREKIRNSLEESLKLECNKTRNLQKVIKDALVLPYSFKLQSESTFTRHADGIVELGISVEANNLNLGITASFLALSDLWIIQATPPIFCNAAVYKYDESGYLQYSYTLSNVGQITQLIILEQNSESVTILAVSSGALVCGGRGSSIWRAKHPFVKLKKLGVSLPSADRATIDSSNSQHINVYFKSGSDNYLYQYQNGMMNKGKSTNKFLNFARSSVLSDGSLITAKLWDGFDLEVVRNKETFWSGITASVEDIRIVEHQGEIILFTSATRRDVHEPKNYLYISKYIEDNLQIVSWLILHKPARILPFKMKISNAVYNFFILLQEYATPTIYEIKGMSVPEVWQKLEIQLQNYVWAEILQEKEDLFNTKILIGDLYKSCLIYLELNGINYINETLVC